MLADQLGVEICDRLFQTLSLNTTMHFECASGVRLNPVNPLLSLRMYPQSKNISFRLVLIVSMLLLGLVGCSSGGGSSSGGGGAGNSKILVIGDSIGTGFGLAVPYPDRIRQATGAEVINDSADGRVTSEGAARVMSLLSVHQPTHLLVLLGTNDARVGTVSGALSNLQFMINAANSSGVIAVVATLPPYLTTATLNNRSAQISSGIRGLGGARIAEVRNALGDGSSTIADGVHPNAAGQQIIADVFSGQL